MTSFSSQPRGSAGTTGSSSFFLPRDPDVQFGRRPQDAPRPAASQRPEAASAWDDLKVVNILPPAFVCLMLSTIVSIYIGLHLLPLLQLDMPPELREPRAFARGCHDLWISHVLVAFLLACYCRAMLTAPGAVPDSPAWKLGMQEVDLSDAWVPLTREVKNTGERRHCKWCLKFKPDRCHHCRVCRTCVLKMDHHCPWIMNCVGFRNHKYFFLLVFYAVAACGFVGGTLFGTVQQSVEEDVPSINRFLLVLSLVLTCIMGTLMLLFFAFHTYLMMNAMTTIEFCEKSATVGTGRPVKKTTYDQRLYGNVAAVLGPRPLLWFLPISPPDGDGISYPVAEDPSFPACRAAFREGAGAEADGDPEWTGSDHRESW